MSTLSNQKKKFNKSVLRSIYNIIYYFFEIHYAKFSTNDVGTINWEKSKQKGYFNKAKQYIKDLMNRNVDDLTNKIVIKKLTFFLMNSRAFQDKNDHLKMRIFLEIIQQNGNFQNKTYEDIWKEALVNFNNINTFSKSLVTIPLNQHNSDENTRIRKNDSAEPTQPATKTQENEPNEDIKMYVYPTYAKEGKYRYLFDFVFCDINGKNLFNDVKKNNSYFLIVIAKKLQQANYLKFNIKNVYLTKKKDSKIPIIAKNIYKTEITDDTNETYNIFLGCFLKFNKNQFFWEKRTQGFLKESDPLEVVYEIISIKNNNGDDFLV